MSTPLATIDKLVYQKCRLNCQNLILAVLNDGLIAAKELF